jgi:hypothetical protein
MKTPFFLDSRRAFLYRACLYMFTVRYRLIFRGPERVLRIP